MKTSEMPENKILDILKKSFGPIEIKLHNDSPKHIGHSHKGEGGHYSVFMISEAFHGLSRIERERSVVTALKPLFDAQLIHAIQLTLRSPEESH